MIGNYTILVINDVFDQLELLKTILQKAGYKVVTAESGNEGFKTARRILPDLIISDVIMPDGDGLELCRLIRAEQDLRFTPILLLSALRKDAESAVKGIEIGADDYLEVPYEPMYLIAKVARLLERKRNEDALRESENRFRSMIENSTDVISILAPDGRIIYESPSLKNVLGFEPEELVGKNAFDLIHPEDAARVVAYFQQALEHPESASPIEYRFLHKDNSWRILQSVGKHFKDSINGLIAIINSRDITEQQKAIEAQRESEIWFRTIFDNAAIGLALVNFEGKCVQSNLSLHKMLGYSREELRQISFAEFTHPDDLAKDMALVKEVFKGERNYYQIEKRYIKKNGEVIWGNLTASVIRDTDGEVQFVVGMVEDITYRKLSEIALKQSEERFKAQFKSLPIPAIIWKRAEDDFILMDFNDAAVDFTRGLIGNFAGVKASEMYDHEPLILEYLSKCFTGRATLKVEAPLILKTTGERKHLDMSFIFIAPDMVMLHYRDITGEVQANAALHFQKALLEAQSEASIDGILVVSPDGEIISCNQRFAEMWEVSEQVLASKSDEKFLDSVLDKLSDEKEFLETVSYLYDHPFVRDQVEINLKDGRTFERYTSPVMDADGTHYGRVWFFRDITNRREVEEAIRFQAELLDTVEQAVISTDLEGKVTYWNQFAQKLYGWTTVEAVGRNIAELTTPEISQEQAAEIMTRLKEGKSWSGEFLVRNKDGEVFPAQVSDSPVFNSEGELIGIVGISCDITERRQFQEKLSQEKNITDATIDSLPGIFYLFDQDFKAIRWNKNLEQVSGYTNEEISRMPPTGFFFDEDKHRVVESLEQAFSKGEVSVELNLKTKQGEKIPFFFNAKRFVLNGAPHLLGTAINISEHKQAEIALRKSQEHLALAQQVARMGSFEWDLVSGVATVSAEFEDLYGLLPGGLQGRYEEWIKYVYSEDLQMVNDNLQATLANGEFANEYRIVRTDGEVRWLFGKGQVFYDETGKPVRMVGVNLDVTNRKIAEEEIIKANERAIREYDRLLQKLTVLAQNTGAARDLQTIFRAILEFTQATIPCTGFFIALYNAEKQLRTPAYAWDGGQEFDVSNLPPMEMSDSPNSRAIATGEVVIEDNFQSAMIGQPVVNIGLENDPNLPQSCLVVPMAFMGRIVGAVEAQSTKRAAFTQEHATAMQMAANLAANAIENVRLIEQERIREEQLRQAQKLESIGRLAGGVAHDFNNMLTAINGYSGMILRQLDNDDPLRPKIEEIKKAGERSASLTHQLLAFSRQQVLNPKILDINEVIVDTSKMLQRLIGEDIQLNLSPGFNIGSIEVDPGQLTQVILNLAVNARDAMPNGGSLLIESSNVYLDEEYAANHFPCKTGEYVMLAVTDTGCGMDNDTLQHIFEPFYTTKEIGKGTGLGLATVYGIIKQSSGYTWVYSEIGKGTTFKIYFPRVDKVSELNETFDAEKIPGGNETVLLVEDEETVRNLTRQILEACGYQVIEAQSGIKALSICRNKDHKIDLLLTDVVMPKMGGRELAEKLKEINPEIRQLYMSGYTDDAIIRQGMITEEMNFIQKPFTFEGLAQKVREVIDAN